MGDDFEACRAKMSAHGMSDAAIAAFSANYERLVAGTSVLVAESDIDAVESLPRLQNRCEEFWSCRVFCGAAAAVESPPQLQNRCEELWSWVCFRTARSCGGLSRGGRSLQRPQP